MYLGRVPKGLIDPNLSIDADFGDDDDEEEQVAEAGPVQVTVTIPAEDSCDEPDDLEMDRTIRKLAREKLKEKLGFRVGDFKYEDVGNTYDENSDIVLTLDCTNIYECDPVREAIGLIYDYEFAYWRKFNALHAWFVKHCQNGVDQCLPSRQITKDDFKALLYDLEKAHDIFKSAIDTPEIRETAYKNYDPLKNADEQQVDFDFYLEYDSKYVSSLEEAFPTAEGFFFGQTSYGWGYFNDVNRTIEIVKDILEDPDFDDWDFRYISSW